jgi:hypothetical protein
MCLLYLPTCSHTHLSTHPPTLPTDQPTHLLSTIEQGLQHEGDYPALEVRLQAALRRAEAAEEQLREAEVVTAVAARGDMAEITGDDAEATGDLDEMTRRAEQAPRLPTYLSFSPADALPLGRPLSSAPTLASPLAPHPNPLALHPRPLALSHSRTVALSHSRPRYHLSPSRPSGGCARWRARRRARWRARWRGSSPPPTPPAPPPPPPPSPPPPPKPTPPPSPPTLPVRRRMTRGSAGRRT